MELQQIAALLREGGNIKIQVRGNSMRPYLIHERDFVVLRKQENVAVGDIVFAEITPGHFILHRIVKIDGQNITTLGDGNIKAEHCKIENICGTVVGFYRKGRTELEKLDTLKYKCYSFFWSRSLPLRGKMLSLHNLIFASCKNLERITPTEGEVEGFLALLRNALWGSEITYDFSKVRWSAICQMANEQTVWGLIAEATNHLPKETRPTGKEANLLIGTYVNLMSAHQRINNNIVKSFQFLQEKGYSPILLKGQGNATFYPNPLLRQCGDIDVYIGPKDYEKACEDIVELVGEEGMKGCKESDKHLEIHFGKDTIELHEFAEVLTNPFLNRRYQRMTEKYLAKDKTEKASINSNEISIPPVQFNAFYVFNHAWHHFLFKGIGLRQICDWTMILHRGYQSIDQEQLKQDLEDLHLMRAWQIMGWIVVNKLALPSQEMPFYSTKFEKEAKRVWQILLDEGNFGRHQTVYAHTIKGSILKQKVRSFILNNLRYIRYLPIAPENFFTAHMNWLFKGVINANNR